ncbi:MAG TPA: DUF4231 domain-containing protein [Aggregatilinea sp.]|jgi:hypothetical protein|uniref:DUF4231 domain-containing protein n=1 Tax=Aggregatilinea sp. TaxID=2806333 RepID=UPI002C381DE4|nr:DUF4231 domain-containing protein [Aggregatilinea sp.]HML25009.1 DUF4231 domain-containing protein [Aggregatilinea sp.]
MAENAASQPAASASRQQPKYFFQNRRPKLRGVPREAVPDSAAAGYQERLAQEGFIALNDWPQATQALREDVRELEQYLMPSFWRWDQLARYYQNRHYLYQWIFILSAFLTTAFSAISVFLNGTTQDVSLGLFDLTDLLAGLTVAVSGIAAMVSFLNANQAPQQNWFKARAKAESLRSLYFTFMARRPPFNADTGRDRSRLLGQSVLDILSDKQEGAKQ